MGLFNERADGDTFVAICLFVRPSFVYTLLTFVHISAIRANFLREILHNRQARKYTLYDQV